MYIEKGEERFVGAHEKETLFLSLTCMYLFSVVAVTSRKIRSLPVRTFFLLCKYLLYQLVAYCVYFKMTCKKSL